MVNDLAISDLYEARKLSPLSDFDYKVVIDLYMPLVGAKSIALYFALYEIDNEHLSTHEKLLRNTGYSIGEVVSCLNALEATGLVATYLGETPKCRIISYCLYAPISPCSFFSDPLFAGTLSKYIGEEDAKKLAKKYSDDEKPEGYKPVSMDFLKYFAPDLNDERYIKSVLVSGGKKSGEIATSFDFKAFLSALTSIDNRYNAWTFSQSEINYISRVQALYGYSEETLADFVNSSFLMNEPVNKRLDKKKLLTLAKDNVRFDYLKVASKEKQVKTPTKGDTGFARTLRLMEKERPIEFLSRLQKGGKIASSDASLLEELTLEMGLNNEVTNALIFYVLCQKNNTLPKAYTEKIAASLVRENVETALDAMNYFSKTSGKKKNSQPVETKKGEIAETSDNSTKKELSNDNKKPEDDVSFDEIFARVRKKKE